MIAAAGGTILHSVPDIGVLKARATIVSSDTFIGNLRADSRVHSAGYDLIADLIMPSQVVADDNTDSIPPPPSTIVGAPAADRYYQPANGNTPPNQWAIYRVGGFGGGIYGFTGGAWDVTKGSSSVTIALLDTGISTLHPDVNGAKLVDAQSAIFGTTPRLPYDTGSPEDQEGHGTWTASLAAGKLDPVGGLGGVVGVAPGVSIAGLKVLTRTASGGGSGEFSWTVAAIVYAANKGYQVISMSLGGFADLTVKDDQAVFVALTRATDFAFNHGSLLVAAAGNNGVNLDNLCNPHVVGSPSTCLVELPGSLPNVIAVTATTNPACVENLSTNVCSSGPDALAFYSNFGSSLHGLSAPGGSLPAAGAIGKTGFVRGACGPGISSNPNSKCFTLGNVYYVRAIGTSASTPLVAGAAALVFSVRPDLSPNQVRSILYQTAQDIGKPGFDEFFQFGLVDAHAAVLRALVTHAGQASAGGKIL